MAGFKKKQVKQKEIPGEKSVTQRENPNSFFDKNPAWAFSRCDKDQWSFTRESVERFFWDEILPFFRNMELRTWADILRNSAKQNHAIDTGSLNSVAQKRLAELHIEEEAIYSLRLQGTHRLYGYMDGNTFVIVWFDPNHGDNNTCVCRSHKKHT